MRNLNEFLNVVRTKCTECGAMGHVPKEFAKTWVCRACKKAKKDKNETS